MVVSFLQILQESVKKCLPGGPRKAVELPPPAIWAMVSTIVAKGIIWIGVYRVDTTQVQALAQGELVTDFVFRMANYSTIRLQDRRHFQHGIIVIPIHWASIQHLVA